MIEGLALESDNVECAAFVIGVTRGAGGAVLYDMAMKSAPIVQICSYLLVAIDTKGGHLVTVGRVVALLAGVLEFGVLGRQITRHQQTLD